MTIQEEIFVTHIIKRGNNSSEERAPKNGGKRKAKNTRVDKRCEQTVHRKRNDPET